MRGDHVYVERRPFGSKVPVGYTHHGIDIGSGKVVHYSGEPGSTEPGRITVSTLEEFLKGGELRVRRYRRDASFHREKSATIAMSRVGETSYHLVFNNCEHFASWCRTGVHWSEQVAEAARLAARTLGNGPALVADSVIRIFRRRRLR